MRITAGGNVGIGTTAPVYKLEVNADMVAHGGGGVAGGNYIGLFKGTGSLPGYPDDSYPTLKTDFGNLYFAVGSKYIGYMSSPDGLLGLFDTNQVEKVHLSTNGNSYFNSGNVGIGTTNPSGKLGVVGNVHVDGTIHGSAVAPFVANGVSGYSDMTVAVYGYGPSNGGVEGESDNGTGVYGITRAASNSRSAGVHSYNEVSGCFVSLSGQGRAITSNCTSSIASDARLKKDVTPVEGALDALMALKPVTFLWNQDSKNKELVTDPTKRAMHYGFIAQDVLKVLPDLVGEDTLPPQTLSKPEAMKTAYALDYEGLIAPTVKAVQELAQQMKELKADNARLRQDIESLKAAAARH